jgi:hypothetical protein
MRKTINAKTGRGFALNSGRIVPVKAAVTQKNPG